MNKKDLEKALEVELEKVFKKENSKEDAEKQRVVQEMRKVINNSNYVLIKKNDYVHLMKCRHALLDLISTLKNQQDVYAVLVNMLENLINIKH